MIFACLQGQYYCNILCNNILTRIIAPYCRTEYCNILIYCFSPNMYIVDQSMAYDGLSAANSCSHISSDLL